jgi:HAE1 family hydrophobic/amphiphilic exporter-1
MENKSSFLKTFIDRPVLSTVISILLVVLGLIGLFTLPIEQYPDIAPPTVQISTNYPGASADVIMNSVIIPLEEAVNGVEGMTYMTSTASNAGTAKIVIYFRKDINPDIASVNVQNLAAKATPQLPAAVKQIGVTIKKQQSSTVLMMSLVSNNPDYDARFLQNYANINILPQIQRVRGVGNAAAYSSQDYSMRVWLKPDKMTAYQISPLEVIAALNDQNIETAPGELGQNSNQTFQYMMNYTGYLKTPQEFENIILRSENGQVLKLKDIADVELGSLSYTVETSTDGKPSVAIAVSQTAGSNARELINDVKAVIDEAAQSFPPGVEILYVMDTSEFLDASILKVIHTLLEAFVLVFLVVFLFLQNVRSTLIPVIAVPVAIIGTFFFLQILGFSINLLTLFALVLAIGIVVDDAIVVVEAVNAELENGETDPKEASLKAMNGIAAAIVSITLVMASVFIPVSFIGGTTGVFYKQFGLTLAVAIMISALNALTLSPALSALFLRAPQKKEKQSGKRNIFKLFFDGFNHTFQAGVEKYGKGIAFLGKKGHRWITLAIIVVFALVLSALIKSLPTGFVPQEDNGSIMGMITLAPGSSLERTDSVIKEVAAIADSITGVNHIMNISGINFMGSSGSSYGSIVIKMKPWDERKISYNEVVSILTEKTKSIENATFLFFGTPTLQGFGLSTGVELSLQDKTGGDIGKFYGISTDFLAELSKREEVLTAYSNFNPNFPQKLIEADVAKIKEAGLLLDDVMTSLQAYVGSMYISNFIAYGKQFRVMIQALPQYRSKLEDLDGLTVRTASGEMAPITEFITIKDITGPQTLERFNMFSSIDATIIPNFTKGYSTGNVIEIVQEVAQQSLPQGYGFEFSGMTREEAAQSNQTVLVFGLCLIFVYLLLAALYESYIIPLSVILCLPVGLCGIYIFLMIFGVHQGIVNNIYVQISLIMLIGLLSKNAILIVEYASQRHKGGMSVIDAAINGAKARLRPILMTSLAFICGLMPLMFASGVGAIGNRSIGISAIGGMLVGTFFGIMVIPTLYIIFQTIQDKFSNKKQPTDETK